MFQGTKIPTAIDAVEPIVGMNTTSSSSMSVATKIAVCVGCCDIKITLVIWIKVACKCTLFLVLDSSHVFVNELWKPRITVKVLIAICAQL